MTLAEMQARREYLLKEIQRRGGAAKAPNFLAQLNAINSDIRAARNVDNGPNPDRIEERIAWLKKNRPNDPEIKKLQQKLAGLQPGPGAGTPGGTQNQPFNEDEVNKFLDGVLDNFRGPDYSKAPKILTSGDLEAERQKVQDSLYNEDTKYLDRNRARDLAEKQQELANRGIPYNPAAEFDPNSKDLYGRTIGAINENYQSEQQAALDRARTGADARMTAEAGVNDAAVKQFTAQATAEYQAQLDKANVGNSLLQTIMSKYNVDQATAQHILDRRSAEKIARIQAAAKGGSGGGGGGGQSGGGFEIVS